MNAAVPLAASLGDTSTVISVLGGIVGLLIAVAGGIGTWAALRVAKNSQLIANYEATAESWEKRSNGLKAENEGLEDEIRQAKETIASLESKNAALADMAYGGPDVNILSADINRGFQLLGEQMSRIEGLVRGGGSGG